MVSLKSYGSFYVGGSNVTLSDLAVEMRQLAKGGAPRPVDPNGDHTTGQMYVQEFRLESPRCPFPVVFWHGGGMTGTNWETTPDGRCGWVMQFLEAGFDVLVSDAVERGRSSWNKYPEIYQTEPLFRTKNDAWDMFRMGPADSYATNPADRTIWPELRFPADAFDSFGCQWVPRWAGHEQMTEAAYSTLLHRIGPCIVVGHSQGGGFALQMSLNEPALIRATVALEPSGAPALPASLPDLPPQLILWGDHIYDHPVWCKYRDIVDDYVQTLREAGKVADMIDLPAEGIRGNSHFLMMDDNAAELGERVIRWIFQYI